MGLQRALPAILKRPLRLPLHITPADILAPIMKLFALRQRDQHLYLALFVEIHLQGHKGLPALAYLSIQFFYLGSVQQELSPPKRFMVETVGIAVGADMGVHQENLGAINAGIAVLQVHRALSA